jgi:signal transduction histidine kinase
MRNTDYKEIINTIPQMIWKVDLNKNIIYSNKPWQNYTGNSCIFDKNIVHPDDEMVTKNAWELSKSTTIFQVRRRLKGYNSEGVFKYNWFLTRGVWLNNFCYGTCTDINELTELKREKLLADTTKIELMKYTELLEKDYKDQKDLAENVKKTLIEDAKKLAINVLENENVSNKHINTLENSIYEKEKIISVLSEESIEKEMERIELAENAKRLEEISIKKEKEKIENQAKLIKSKYISLEKKKKQVKEEELEIEKEKEMIQLEQTKIQYSEKTENLLSEILKKDKERLFSEKQRFHLKAKADTLKYHNLELIKAKSAEEELLSFLSHEIRNSLTQIISMNVFLQDTSLTNEQEEYLTILQNSSDFMLRLVNNLLDKKKLSFKEESNFIDLNNLFKDIIKINEKLIIQKELTFNRQIPEFKFKVLSNYDKLVQILTNIFGNAIKFTEKGSISLIVEILNETDSELNLQISISDTGIGIPADKIDSLFKPFSQTSDEIQHLYGGSGLGLSICRKLLTVMAGTINVSSIFNEGTTFTINIPMQKECE